MEVFVPRFVLDLPVANNPDILNITLARIDPEDLTRVMAHWAKLNIMLDANTDDKTIKKYFRDSISTVCKNPVEKNVFAKYLLRPHITVHSGAKAGNKYAEKIARKAAHEIGSLVRQHGFCLWYGGGSQGLMGESGAGFAEPGPTAYPDQYSLQVSPRQFVVGIKNAVNGMAAVNEGLAYNTDAAIVMPHFIGRRHVLDTALTEADAAITLAGSIGSLDEWSDIAAHVKTGLMPNRKLVGINLQVPRVFELPAGFGTLRVCVPFIKEGFWDALEKQRKVFVKYGFSKQEEIDAMPFKRTPEAAFSYLMKQLDAEGLNPHKVHEERLAAYKAKRPEAALAEPLSAAAHSVAEARPS